MIVQLACLASPTSSSAANHNLHNALLASSSCRFTKLDKVTALSLLTVSPAFYDCVVPILYEIVILARPSALAAFSSLLSSRPYLCQHIKALHVGDVDRLPQGWYPLRTHSCFYEIDRNSPSSNYYTHHTYIRDSLTGKEQTGPAPSWWEAAHEWSVESPGGFHAPSLAIWGALCAAQRSIDVDLRGLNSRYGQEHRTLSRTDYLIRLHELRATIDLYLLAMRRLEGVGPRTFPPLRIKGHRDVPRLSLFDATDLEEPFIVSRSDIARHLARPGSITDRFDHPLLFARSGIDAQEDGKVGREGSDAEWERLFTASVHSSSASAAPTLASCLDLCRRLLASSPNLTHLSLTSFLQRALAIPRSAAPQRLRFLSIGPSLPCQWAPPTGLDAFSHLETLQLCSMALPDDYLAGVLVHLPALKLLEWCLSENLTQGGLIG